MEAVILAWTPAGPRWTGTYAADVATVRRSGVLRQPWTLPSATGISVGMDVWLVVVDGGPAMQGLIGHGVLARVSPRTPEDDHRAIDVDFDLLLQHGDQVPLSVLEQYLPGLVPRGAGAVPVGGADAAALRMVWAEAVVPDRGAVDPVPGALPSRLTRRVTVDRCEYDGDLRRTALAHRGSTCHACGLDMEETYGETGRDLVEVHHTTPLVHLTDEYEADPITDLVPLCPSCHVVAHSRWPSAYSVGEIRSMLRTGGHLRGVIMTDGQLEAESAAARLLGAQDGAAREGRTTAGPP